jgi:hypothetical protein
MQRLEISGAVRPLKWSLGVRGLIHSPLQFPLWQSQRNREVLWILAQMVWYGINPLTPNDHYRRRTASLTSKLHFIYLFNKYRY